MTPAELECLTAPKLSHAARVLYMLFLRPAAERGIHEISLSAAATFLDCPDSAFPFSGSIENARACLSELKQAGLAALTGDLSGSAVQVSLPLFEQQNREMPKESFIMPLSWRPGPAFAEQAAYAGLLSADFSESELSSFVRYWHDRNEYRTQHAWERAFAARLKRRMTAL